MDQFCETLFEYYGEVVLDKKGCGFDGEALQGELAEYIPEKKGRIRAEDVVFDHYHRWASVAFGIGLRLGLSFSDGQVRCPRPEQV